MGPFDAALGLAAVGANALDVQLEQDQGKLGVTIAAGRTRLVDPEDAGLVTLERHVLAMALQIGARCGEVRERRL